MQNFEEQTEHMGLFSFDLITVVRDVVRRWYLIVVAALLVSMGTYVLFDMTYRPDYTTNTTFVVSTRGSSATVYQNLSATTNLASVFTEVLNSSILRSCILEELEMDSFDGSIRASAIPETNLLTLQVTSSDPRSAFLVAQAIIENHSIVSYQVLGDTVLEVLQEPVVPTSPSNPLDALAGAKKAAFVAAAAMCMLLAALSYLRDTVRSRQEGEQKLDARFLGEIHHEQKYKTLLALLRQKKTSILITKPTTSFHFVESIRKLRRRVEQRLGDEKKVILVTSVLENEGKSTVAVNLALSLAQKHRKVLLIDCDLRKPACHKLLERQHRGCGTIDVISGRRELEAGLAREKNTGLYLLLERKSLQSSTNLVGSAGMDALLKQCRAKFDVVIVDLPPMTAAPDTESVVEFADAAILVVKQNTASASQLNSAAAALGGGQSKLLGYVLNNVYSSPLASQNGYGYGYGYGYGRHRKHSSYPSAETSHK